MTSRILAFAAGGVVSLSLVGGTAVAATGGTFLLGKSNTASTTTTLTHAKGTPLSLKAGSGKAPLAVNSKTKVTNLNADTVDGLDSSAFALKKGKTGVFEYYSTPVDVDSDGLVDVLYAYASCPSGTQMTGGGGGDLTTTGQVVVSSPDTELPETWDYIAFVDEATTENPQDLYASVVCYSPDGTKLSGSFRRPTDAAKLPTGTLARIEAKARAHARD
jgi:hypothetical protein